MNKDPIGIFDSGVGGLTIYEEVHKLLPHEDIIYLADSKNAPYGSKSKQEIVDLCVKNTEYLISLGCKMIVVACNTASTNAVKHLRSHYDLPFIRVQPAIKPAALSSKKKIVGMLATRSTLESELLYETSQKFAQGVEVVSTEGVGLVHMIEHGQMNSPEMEQRLKELLIPMVDKGIDQLVLGCTHYPFLRKQIEDIVGDQVRVLDSGEAIARQTKVILEQEQLINTDLTEGKRRFLTNKDPEVLQDLLDTYRESLTAEKVDF